VPLDGELRQQLQGLQAGDVRFDESLSGWTAFACGGPADALVLVADVAAWGQLLSWCRQAKVGVTTVGHGRGIAVRSGGIRGVVVVTSRLDRVTRAQARGDLGLPQDADEGDLVVEAGIPMRDLLSVLAELGAELDLAGIGTLGGAIRRCWPELRERVLFVGVVGDRAKVRWFAAADVEAGVFPVKRRQGIAAVIFRPVSMPSATLFTVGSKATTEDSCERPDWVDGKLRIFSDIPGSCAADVLDSLNARGIRLRDVSIDDTDPNVAVNLGQGTVQDLGLLVKYLAERAEKETGTELTQAYRVNGKKRRP